MIKRLFLIAVAACSMSSATDAFGKYVYFWGTGPSSAPQSFKEVLKRSTQVGVGVTVVLAPLGGFAGAVRVGALFAGITFAVEGSSYMLAKRRKAKQLKPKIETKNIDYREARREARFKNMSKFTGNKTV